MEENAISSMLRDHLERNGISQGDSSLWMVGASPLGGRGLFASRDIAVGELIFVDVPLIFGPRARDKHLPLCAGCYKKNSPLFSCDGDCGLPICSTDCELSSEHKRECAILSGWKPTCGSSWSVDILRALVPVRALFLDAEERRLVYALEWHDGPQHGSEIDLLKSNVQTEIKKSDEQFMRRVCAVLDTNSFETAASVSGVVTSLRGLYPMGALQNHCCAPNTRHYFDSEKKLYVIASLAVKKGEEITMTYTDLFWDTTLRRRHLAGTKHFFCGCKRCADSSENGTLLGALRCANVECTGLLLAVEPLDSSTSWKCNECGLSVKNRQIVAIRSALVSIAAEMTNENPRQVLRFMKRELPALVPATNYVSVDFKLRIISSLGNVENFYFKDLTENEIRIKETYCRDLISLIDMLKLGECKMKGLIAYELYSALEELGKRQTNRDQDRIVEDSDLQMNIEEELNELSNISAAILNNDITSPRN